MKHALSFTKSKTGVILVLVKLKACFNEFLISLGKYLQSKINANGISRKFKVMNGKFILYRIVL